MLILILMLLCYYVSVCVIVVGFVVTNVHDPTLVAEGKGRMSSRKNPPSFDPEADDYASWKSDVDIWRLYTDTAETKVGPAVYLALQGKARDVVRGMSPEDIGSATGYDTIVAELDKVYLSNESSRAFVAFLRSITSFRERAGKIGKVSLWNLRNGIRRLKRV